MSLKNQYMARLELSGTGLSPSDRQSVEDLLTAPSALRQEITDLLSEARLCPAQSRFIQDALAVVLKAVQLGTRADSGSGSERVFYALSQPEVLAALAPSDPLAAARLRGAQVQQSLLNGAYSSEEVAKLLRMTRQGVDKRRRQGQLLGLSVGRRGYRYPAWQFQEGNVLPGLPDILAAFTDLNPWTQAVFFTTGDLRLGGKTPLEVLQAGQVDAVVQAAAAYGHQGAA